MGAQYVFWNGRTESPLDEGNWHDCILMHDLELLSLNSIWEAAKRGGYDPVILFSCGKGQRASEILVGEEHHGAFSYVAIRLLEANPEKTLRTLIVEVNEILHSHGLTQRAEVLCRKGLLNKPFGTSDFTVVSDACRSESTPKIPPSVETVDAAEPSAFRRLSRQLARILNRAESKVITFSGHGRRVVNVSLD